MVPNCLFLYFPPKAWAASSIKIKFIFFAKFFFIFSKLDGDAWTNEQAL